MSSDQKLLFITGASSGIGLATTEKFLAQGYRAVNVSRKRCPLDAVVSLQANLAGDGWQGVVQPWVEANVQAATQIVLVHNAAAAWHDTADNVTSQGLRDMLELSLVTPALLNRLLLPRMSRGSAIIYVGSTLSTKAVPNSFSYITAKHALSGMMKATCQDLFGRGIYTACVCPGTTDTAMLHALYGQDEGLIDHFKAMIGESRLIRPDEIADVIYLAATTPAINGALIQANYGQLQR